MGVFCIVAGPRLGGKSTLAGTLPGKTVMLQAAVLETGSRSALALARKLGNKLEVVQFNDLVDFRTKYEAALKSDCDSIYIDGYAAINDLRWAGADIQAAFKKNNFEAFGKHGDEMTKLCLYIKAGVSAKNIFLTCAMKLKQDKEKDEQDVVCEVNGKIAATSLTKLGECVVSVMMVQTESGPRRVMVTKTMDKWPGRVDGVLDDDNPGVCVPDLSIVLRMVDGTYVKGVAA
mgnify:CR=1 FL=1